MRLPVRAIIAALALCACQPLTETTISSRASGEGYSLERQRADVAALQDARKAAYVKDVRTQQVPADWIAFAYHGEVLDANLEPVALDEKTIDTIAQSLYKRLFATAGKAASEKYPGIEKLFAASGLNPRERAEARMTALDGLLSVADQAQVDAARWRVDVLRGGVAAINWQYTISPAVLAWILGHGIPVWTPPPGQDYIDACAEAGVPIPPDWPSDDWFHQGSLAFNFLGSTGVNVYTYTDPFAPEFAGICYALPRTNASGAVGFVGMICQNNATGKACFWDNITRDNARRLLAADYPLQIGRIGDGFTLRETCTECHRGDNVFNIHPETALDVDRRWTRALTRFSPIARPGFANPPPRAMPPVPDGQRSCSGCHTLPVLSAQYCASVLAPAARFTMPENWEDEPLADRLPAGWPWSPVRPAFTAHITDLHTACATAP